MIRVRALAVVLIAGLFAIFIGGAFLKAVLPGLLVPNFLIMVLVYLALREASCFGVFCAFLLGLEYDICAGTLLGPWAGAFVVAYAALALAAERVFAQSILVVIGAVFAVSLFTSVLYILLVASFIPIGFEKLYPIVTEAALSAALAPMVFACAGRLSAQSDEYRLMGRSQFVGG